MFSDDDVAAHIRETFGGRGVAPYARVAEYGQRDANGVGVEGHKAKLRREQGERLSLAHVGTSRFQSRLRWSK